MKRLCMLLLVGLLLIGCSPRTPEEENAYQKHSQRRQQERGEKDLQAHQHAVKKEAACRVALMSIIKLMAEAKTGYQMETLNRAYRAAYSDWRAAWRDIGNK